MSSFFTFTEVLFLAEWWSGSDVRVFASDDTYRHWGKEHALIIMNHTFEVDWLMGWIVADRSQTLGVNHPLVMMELNDKTFISFSMKEVLYISVLLCFINSNFFSTRLIKDYSFTVCKSVRQENDAVCPNNRVGLAIL